MSHAMEKHTGCQWFIRRLFRARRRWWESPLSDK